MGVHRPIPDTLPGLPPSLALPWSAEVIQAHRGLCAAFKASQTTLNLDESDPIHLGHHLHQAKTFMVLIVDVLVIAVNFLPIFFQHYTFLSHNFPT